MFISVLGLGQAGGNVAEEFAKRGYYCAAINFSQRDLDSLEEVELKLHLVGSEGIGKERSHAIELMQDNWDLASNFVKKHFSHSSIEIVLVPFASSGGSGSGIAPVLIQLLIELMPEKTFVAMPIIPSLNEVYKNQRNCLDLFEDLSKLDICILPIDNEKFHTNLHKVGRSGTHSYINSQVCVLIDEIAQYTDKDSKFGVLDRKDLKNIFNTKGLATISKVDLSKLSDSNNISEQGVADKIHESWSNGIFADISFDKVTSAGVIFDGNEKWMDLIDYKNIFSKFENKMPINLFEGYYNEKKGEVITILTGLSWCNERLEKIDEVIEKINFEKLTQDDAPYQSKTQHLFKTENKKSVVKDISNIISQFRR